MGGAAYPERGADGALTDSFNRDLEGAHHKSRGLAPGIAEALLATALGLVAAIPAVMIYNVLARSTAHYRA
jgi:biopolymer transport protein ExbB